MDCLSLILPKIIPAVGIPHGKHLTFRCRKSPNYAVSTIQEESIIQALLLLAKRCPRLIHHCYWAGTSSVAVEELHHRESFDLDFHTRVAHERTTPLMMELQSAFPDRFRVLQSPDEYGSGFQGLLQLPSGDEITIEVLSNYQTIPDNDLEDARTVRGVKRVTLVRYLEDKIQCIAERSEARDLVDVMAVLKHAPELEAKARKTLLEQDALLVIERLTGWSDADIETDLTAYPDVDPGLATQGRDLLLSWLKVAPQ
jgi:hypothetical protein